MSAWQSCHAMHVTCACVQHKCVCVCGVRGVCVLSRNWSIHHAHEPPFRHRTRSDRAVAPQLHQLFANAAADDIVALCVPRPQQHDQYADERDARADVVAVQRRMPSIAAPHANDRIMKKPPYAAYTRANASSPTTDCGAAGKGRGEMGGGGEAAHPRAFVGVSGGALLSACAALGACEDVRRAAPQARSHSPQASARRARRATPASPRAALATRAIRRRPPSGPPPRTGKGSARHRPRAAWRARSSPPAARPRRAPQRVCGARTRRRGPARRDSRVPPTPARPGERAHKRERLHASARTHACTRARAHTHVVTLAEAPAFELATSPGWG